VTGISSAISSSAAFDCNAAHEEWPNVSQNHCVCHRSSVFGKRGGFGRVDSANSKRVFTARQSPFRAPGGSAFCFLQLAVPSIGGRGEVGIAGEDSFADEGVRAICPSVIWMESASSSTGKSNMVVTWCAD
jgi:hypothetical protein